MTKFEKRFSRHKVTCITLLSSSYLLIQCSSHVLVFLFIHIYFTDLIVNNFRLTITLKRKICPEFFSSCGSKLCLVRRWGGTIMFYQTQKETYKSLYKEPNDRLVPWDNVLIYALELGIEMTGNVWFLSFFFYDQKL